MSTTGRDGETWLDLQQLTNLVENYLTEVRNASLEAYKTPRGYSSAITVNARLDSGLITCFQHLEMFRNILLDSIIKNNDRSTVKRTRSSLLDIVDLLEQCRCKVGIASTKTIDQCREDCFDALERKVFMLGQPPPEDLSFDRTDPIAASPRPSNPSGTPQQSSPIMTNTSPAASSSNRASPAMLDEPSIAIKQEQEINGVESEPYDRSHLRKDSHMLSQPSTTPKERMLESLPPIHHLHNNTNGTITEIPSPHLYDQVLLPSLKNSPSTNSIASPQSPNIRRADSTYSQNQDYEVMTAFSSPEWSNIHPPLLPPMQPRYQPGPPSTADFPPFSSPKDRRPPGSS